MIYKITCEICGKIIDTSYRTKKTCNKEKCIKTRHSNEVRRYQIENRDVWNKYQREYKSGKAKKPEAK